MPALRPSRFARTAAFCTFHPRTLARLAAASLTLTAGAQSFTNLGVMQSDHHFSQGLAVSGDGRTVVGDSAVDFFDQVKAYRWTRAAGMQDIGILPEAINSFALAVNADGSAIAGACYGDRDFAFRWTARRGMQDIGMLPNAMYGASSAGISADGRKVTGTSSTESGDFHAFLWTEGRDMLDLGTLPGGAYSFATAISGDGNSVVGISAASDGEFAFRWTVRRGMQALPSARPAEAAGAFAVNTSGNVIVGYSGATAAAWRGDVVQDLGPIPGGSFSVAYAVSGNGQVIGGGGDDAAGDFVASVWTSATGTVAASDYFTAQGIDLTGWQLLVVAGISIDGKTFVGEGVIDGESRAWKVDLNNCTGPGRGRGNGRDDDDDRPRRGR